MSNWNKKQWRKLYIERLCTVLTKKEALESFRTMDKSDMYDTHPEIAADDELSYMNEDS